jgi:glycosyltransferase involved in cell wall biosynthesis
MDSSPRVLVVQHGARHRYAIPRMLHELGYLAGLYTDSSSHSILGAVASVLKGAASRQLQRVARRRISGIPRNLIRSSDVNTRCEAFNSLCGKNSGSALELFRKRHERLSRRMIGWGLRDANVVYSMYYENLDFVRWAKGQGFLSVVDVYVSPLTDEIMANHKSCFAQESGFYDAETIKTKLKMWAEVAGLADILLCPSEWVATGVRELSPEHADKIRIVPYGCSINYEGRLNQPVKGRVLFAGSDVVRKGIQDLAVAATSLKESNPDIEVRIAGSVPDVIKSHPVCADLVFLGSLEPNEMKEAFLSADVFVLPSLSEGYAGVVAEAVGAGCPVIVTKESGSFVQHHEEGLVVPSEDPAELAKAIVRLVYNRELRDRCAKNCLERLDAYTIDTWRKKLSIVIEETLSS